MSDNQNQMQMPAAPSAGGAPGQYPPLNIPQSTIEANAMTDAMNNNGNGLNSPGSAGGPRRAAPEPNKRALYVGGLDPRVTEEVLKQIFETTGHVQSVKIIPDKNVSTNRTAASPSIPHVVVTVSIVSAVTYSNHGCLDCMRIHVHASCGFTCCLRRLRWPRCLLSPLPTRFVVLNHHSLTLPSSSSSQKDSTTASLSTTILLRQNEQCRLSTEDVSTSR